MAHTTIKCNASTSMHVNGAHLLELAMGNTIAVYDNRLRLHAIVPMSKQNEEILDIVLHVGDNLLSILQRLDTARILRKGTAQTTTYMAISRYDQCISTLHFISELPTHVAGEVLCVQMPG
jgi:hypothetical protein